MVSKKVEKNRKHFGKRKTELSLHDEKIEDYLKIVSLEALCQFSPNTMDYFTTFATLSNIKARVTSSLALGL